VTSPTIGPGTTQIDTLLGGWDRVTASYLLEGPEPVLIETGSRTSVQTVLEALTALGLEPGDLAGIAVTHIHLDHAGGVGDLAWAFPKSKIYVHEKGARHLADPTRLVASAARVYGPLLDSLYGRLEPTPPDRIHVLSDGEGLRVGPGRTLTAIESPGHAKHHVGFHDSESGILFVGDAVGVRLPDAGVLRPATPPADFDLNLAIASLRRFAARSPSGLALAHFGLLSDPDQILREAESRLRRWAEVAEGAWQAGRDIGQALQEAFGAELNAVDAAHKEKAETLPGIESNAEGLRRWLEARERPVAPAP